MAKTVIFIQSRIGSRRLPGKVTLPLGNGKTVLEMCRERCLESGYPTFIITPCGEGGDFEGPEDDVLARYVLSGHKAGLDYNDIVVRVTSDCPLVDPNVIREMVDLYNQSDGVEYVSSSPRWENARGYPHGTDVEVIRFETLIDLANNLDAKDPRREHVTQALYKGPLNIDVTMRGPASLEKDYTHLDYSIDTEVDYKIMKEIIAEGLSPQTAPFEIADKFKQKQERINANDK